VYHTLDWDSTVWFYSVSQTWLRLYSVILQCITHLIETLQCDFTVYYRLDWDSTVWFYSVSHTWLRLYSVYHTLGWDSTVCITHLVDVRCCTMLLFAVINIVVVITGISSYLILLVLHYLCVFLYILYILYLLLYIVIYLSLVCDCVMLSFVCFWLFSVSESVLKFWRDRQQHKGTNGRVSTAFKEPSKSRLHRRHEGVLWWSLVATVIEKLGLIQCVSRKNRTATISVT